MPEADSTKLPAVIAEAKTQQYGYVRAYRAVMHECGAVPAILYGILEDYAQMGARTGKGCIPSHPHLAELVGISERSVRTHLTTLKARGWIEWTTLGGKVNQYYLPRQILPVPRQILPGTPVKSAGDLNVVNNQIEQTTPLPPASEAPALAGSRQRYPTDFETLWREYGPTNGPKKPAATAWERLSKADRAAAMEALPRWVKSDQWQRGYKPYPQKYLNQRMWEGDPTVLTAASNGYVNEEIDANIARIIAGVKENQPK